MALTLFKDRRDAGRRLAQVVARLPDLDKTIVLALPRGGVPVAFEVAKELHVPLDLLLVRKVGVPGHEELAMGAVAYPDVRAMNREVIVSLTIPNELIEEVVAKQMKEMERQNHVYRNDGAPAILKDKTVILVDDGAATGADMRAAIKAVRQRAPRRVIAAIPVAPFDAVAALGQEADHVVCLETPSLFFGVGQAYEDFSQTTDEEVIDLLKKAKEE